MKTQKRWFALIGILILLTALTACAAANDTSEAWVGDDYDYSRDVQSEGIVEKEVLTDGEMAPGVEAPMEEPMVEVEEEMDWGDDETTNSGGGELEVQRMIIMNAEVSLIVADPAGKADEITLMASNMGGWVVYSNVYALETETKKIFNADITIRVPVERLNEALDLIKSDAIEIEYDNKNGQDVTEAYTDLESRLRNLEETADKLREILAATENTDDALDVLSTLTEITEQIEVIEGQMQYYSEASAMSSITVHLEAPLELYTPTPTMTPTATPVPTSAVWNPGATASSSLTTLKNFMQGLGDFLITFILLWLPILLLLILPFVLVIWFLRFLYLRSRRKNKKAAAPPAPVVEKKEE